MKHFEIDKDKDICAIGIGFVFNRLYDKKYEHRLEIIILFWMIAFVWTTKYKIGKQ